MSKFQFVCLFLFCCLFSNGQSTETIEAMLPLKSQGTLPEYVTKNPEKKFDETLSKIETKHPDLEYDAEKMVGWINNYHDRALRGGKVLFNHPVTNYINQVKDEVLKGYPELQEEIKFHAVRTPIVNAQMGGNGIGYFNIGLIAQLSNEAQLAYIVCHEIAHHLEEHLLKGYIEREKIASGDERYESVDHDERLLVKRLYSKELEFEADRVGLQLFMETDYSQKGVKRAFDLLQYSYLPIDEVSFDPSFFEYDHFQFPEGYVLDKVNSINNDDDARDLYSTHPNIESRRDSIDDLISNKEWEGGGQEFIVNKDLFNKARKASRFELSRLFLVKKEYVRSLYNSYILLQEHPESKYLKKMVSLALYQLSTHRTMEVSTPYHDPEDIQGESHRLYHLIDTMTTNELNVLSLRSSWEYTSEYPDDKVMAKVNKQNFANLMEGGALEPEDFAHVPREEYLKQMEEEKKKEKKEGEKEELSKYEKIEKQEKEEMAVDSSKVTFAFVDLYQEGDQFEKSFEKAEKNHDGDKNLTMDKYFESSDKGAGEEEEEKRNIEELVMVSPYYEDQNLRKGEVNYLDYTQAERELDDELKKLGEKAGVDIKLINTREMESIDHLNDKGFASEWLEENAQFKEEGYDWMLTQIGTSQSLREKYGSRYFGWMSRENYQTNYDAGKIVLYSVSMVLLPYLPVYLLKKEWQTEYYFWVVDMKTGDIVYKESNSIPKRDAKDFMRTKIYDSLLQLSEL